MSLSSLEDLIGYKFRRREHLLEALAHKSYAAERRGESQNERLEFLGDSVLALVTAHYLYTLHPDSDEGKLSKQKAVLVSKASLCEWAREIGMGKFVLLGAGEESTGGRSRPSILANALEALIGAIYLDGGHDAAARFVVEWLNRKPGVLTETDFKSRLQEIVQKRYKSPPVYDLAQTEGPDHDKTFLVTVRLDRYTIGGGSGKSKKEAEQAAAKDALKKILTDIL